MDIYYPLNQNINFKKSIFLAGPTYRTNENTIEVKKSWRIECLNIFNDLGFDGNIIVPELDGNKPDEWTYSRQISWEQNGLKRADIILFWIPRNLEDLPGFTTNIEFGEYLYSGKIVIGSPEFAEKNRYLKERCSQISIIWYNDLKLLCKYTVDKMKLENITKTFFTSDLHFSDERTLNLFKRPFKDINDMDYTIIKNWNYKITKDDIVYILGDIGNIKMLDYLNYRKIFLVKGNYDNNISQSIFDQYKVIIIPSNKTIVIKDYELELVHEPSKRLNFDRFYLFGHIHQLGMIKSKGLNVGVDCHNYYPLDISEILFYLNAIDKHYDKEVFIK